MKRLVICCDGTWSRSAAPSHVARFAARVASEDGGIRQLTYYDPGFGLGFFGFGLDQKILEAYRFVSAHYEVGDELYFFGFSRGAYTVRSLAGLIRKCGIPRREKLLNESDSIALYRTAEHPDAPRPRTLRRHNSMNGEPPIPIQCIGVWDTVGELGIPHTLALRPWQERYQFHDATLSRSVKHAFQALSIDERRPALTPSLWTNTPVAGQTIEQVWFSGSHRDVGGAGDARLASITLAWMIDKARSAGLAVAASDQPDSQARSHWLAGTLPWPSRARPRSIGSDGTQSIAPSAAARYRTLRGYKPENLREFYARASTLGRASSSSSPSAPH